VARFTVAGWALGLVCLGAAQSLCFGQTPQQTSTEPQLFGENVISTADGQSHPAFTPNGLRDIYKIDISAVDSDSSFHRRNKTGIM
jgi:hypothetical protein